MENKLVKYEVDIKSYLNNFYYLIKAINGDNLVLAGTNALKLHGLKMSRQANDIDVVLFQPTEKQMQVLRNLSMMVVGDKQHFHNDHEKIQDENYPLDKILLKFKKNDMFIDIHITTEPCPLNL